MTDLEYMIYEAEASGEISIDTRDEMLTILEHGGAYRRYMKMLEDKQKKADKLSKYATGERKRKYDQESHDLGIEYLTYTNTRRFNDSVSKIKEGLDPKYIYAINGNGEKEFSKGDFHLDISKDRYFRKKNGKNNSGNAKDDLHIGKLLFKQNFGGPQKKTKYDVVHSGYKKSKTGPDFKKSLNVNKKEAIKKPESKQSSSKFDDELYD